MSTELDSRIGLIARLLTAACFFFFFFFFFCWWCLQVYALGFVSVFDQILDGFDAGDKEALFSAYVKAIGEDPAQYRVSGQGAAPTGLGAGQGTATALLPRTKITGAA
jgi:hypothetical protein